MKPSQNLHVAIGLWCLLVIPAALIYWIWSGDGRLAATAAVIGVTIGYMGKV